MPEIILVAESGADIPQEYLEKFHIFIVPMHVQFGNYSKQDGSFSPQEIVNYFQEKHQIPKTSSANTEDFERVFGRIEYQYPGADILYLAYSAVTTCSFGCARIAAEGKPWVYALDTKLYTIGQGMVVIRMAELLAQHPESSRSGICQRPVGSSSWFGNRIRTGRKEAAADHRRDHG